jgi:Phosphotransferase enzyme family
MTTALSPPTDEDVLRQCLGATLPEALGRPCAITSVRRQRFDLATSYSAQVVDVRLDSGDEVRVFLKDFSVTVRPKDGPKQRREREVRVYRELLAGAGLGTPRYYGSVLDEPGGRLWLLLEFVDGTPVGYLDIAGHWAPAAARLGRLHGHFAGQSERLSRCDFLLRHDEEFFWSKTERAARCVSAIAPHRAGELTRVVDRYGPVVGVMIGQPRTLLHGGCRTSNILVSVASDPARVCILDWEEAAYGPPLLDVAYLLDGVESPTLDPLLDAYVREVRAYDLPLPPRQDLKLVIDCFRLHMTLAMLGQAVLKGYKEKDVTKLLAIAGQLSDAVSGGGTQR